MLNLYSGKLILHSSEGPVGSNVGPLNHAELSLLQIGQII